jgi:glycosyltransferase involved in cell wall biosynthesis
MADIDVSVVIPAYDEQEFVAAALRSVAEQTIPASRIEVIVVANGCTDRTSEVAICFAAKNPQLFVRLIEEPEAGVSRAKNIGAASARGDVLIFLDADSRMAPDLAERILERIGRGERAASIKMTADTTDLLDRGFFNLIEYGKRLVRVRANMLYCTRAVFLSAAGFNEDLHHAEDLDLLTRLKRRGVAVGHVSESWIATSPRRLHSLPLRLGMVTTLGRWGLGNFGIGRRWSY